MSTRFLVKIISIVATLLTAAIYPEAPQKKVDIFADLLYWYIGETVDWAFVLSGNETAFHSSYKTFTFDWAPGFCVGLGYTMEHDQWDSQASYTWFQSKATDQIKGAVTSAFLPARLSLLEPFTTGNGSLHLHYNIFDWDLGRNFQASNTLSIRPAIGLKGGWISQNLRTYWTKPHAFDLFLLTASETLHQTFQGGGPKGGVSGSWLLGNIQTHSFNLIGQLETGYLWGHWSIQDKYTDNLDTIIYLKTTERNFGALVFYSFLGLGWDCNFNRDRSHFGLKIGYELEDWLNHFQIFSDFSGSQNNDLILQGLNLSLQVDF